jgi:hypothetical protein
LLSKYEDDIISNQKMSGKYMSRANSPPVKPTKLSLIEQELGLNPSRFELTPEQPFIPVKGVLYIFTVIEGPDREIKIFAGVEQPWLYDCINEAHRGQKLPWNNQELKLKASQLLMRAILQEKKIKEPNPDYEEYARAFANNPEVATAGDHLDSEIVQSFHTQIRKGKNKYGHPSLVAKPDSDEIETDKTKVLCGGEFKYEGTEVTYNLKSGRFFIRPSELQSEICRKLEFGLTHTEKKLKAIYDKPLESPRDVWDHICAKNDRTAEYGPTDSPYARCHLMIDLCLYMVKFEIGKNDDGGIFKTIKKQVRKYADDILLPGGEASLALPKDFFDKLETQVNENLDTHLIADNIPIFRDGTPRDEIIRSIIIRVRKSLAFLKIKFFPPIQEAIAQGTFTCPTAPKQIPPPPQEPTKKGQKEADAGSKPEHAFDGSTFTV